MPASGSTEGLMAMMVAPRCLARINMRGPSMAGDEKMGCLAQ
jgi:hypothetical protein